jgi:hypothetical protein
MTNRCDACKHWDEESGYRAGSLRTGECHRAIMWWDATEWVDETPNFDDAYRRLCPQYEGTKMFVQDASDHMATLYTTADFFCAHFEQRESQ